MAFAELSGGFLAGVGLGALFFGALWLTVRRMPSASGPVLLAAGSYLVRLGGLGAGLYAVVHLGGATALLAALLGVLAARQIMIGRIAPANGRVVRAAKDVAAGATARGKRAPGSGRG
jgi:F1F0 ATPase subunit 2